MADDPNNVNENEAKQQDSSVIDKASDYKDKFDKGKDFADRFKKGSDAGTKTASPTSPATPTTPATPAAPAAPAAPVAPAAAPVAPAATAPAATAPAATAPAAVAPAAAAPAAGGAAAGVSVIGIAGIIILVIVALFLLTGIIVALVYLPGSLGEAIKGFFRGIGEYFAGEDAMLNNEDFAKVANMIQARGYDLYAEGYINDKLDPETDFNEEGDIKQLPKQKNKKFPHLIDLYTRMDAYTYRIRNVASLKSLQNQDMSGLLQLFEGTWKNNELVSQSYFLQGNYKDRIVLKRDEGIISIKKSTFGGTYNFQIEGWSGRYGLPLEFFMALHQGTRAPDLVREIAKGTKAYTSKSYAEESIEYFDQIDKDILYYKKPILNILLLKTTIVNTVNFVIPETTTINGEVYVLKKPININDEFDSNPFTLKESDFTKKSTLTGEEVYQAYFKAPTGQFIRIKPEKSKSNPGLKYLVGNIDAGYIPYKRDSNGVLKTEPYENKKVTDDDGNEKTQYKVKLENYDFSSLYFTKDGENYKVKDLRGKIIKKSDFYSFNKGKFIDEYGLYAAVAELRKINEEINTYEDFHKIVKEVFAETDKSATYIPLIKNSENHWFRDVYFHMNEGDKYVVEDKDYFLLTGEKWAKYEISEEDGKKILTPEMAEVKEGGWSAYEIKETKLEDSLGVPLITTEKRYEGLSKYLFMHEDKTVSATQKQEGRRGMTNARTKNLFSNVEWYKYDGSIDRADANNEDRLKPEGEKDPTLKSLIDSDNDLLAAFEILEGSRSLDAQYILRDLKELYVELGYFEKEDLRDPVRRVLRWPLNQYNTPRMWPAADIHQDSEGYGVFVPSKKTLENIYDKETLADNESIVGEGFEKGENVISPVTGRIEEIGVKDVTRTVTDLDGKLRRIVYKDVGYITISAIDNTAPAEAEPYKEFYENEYKGVIAGKVKHGKQAEDSRYIEGNKITIEGITVEIPEDVNDKKNSNYIRQIKSSDIKKVQDEETQKQAEEIEQKKIDAPNYIAVSGSVGHIGDYIKEGTIIGKTTESDLRILMRDADKAFIENVDRYIVLDSGFYIDIMDDYYTKVEPGEANVMTDIDMFKEILTGFPQLQENAQAFMDMQDKYGVNAIFAAAVTIQECQGGNSNHGVNFGIREKYGGTHNNIFSVQRKKPSAGEKYYETSMDGKPIYWRVHEDIPKAIDHFGDLISKSDGSYWAQNKYFVSEIAPTYCNDAWGVSVNSIITRLLDKAQANLQGSFGGYSGEISVAVQQIFDELKNHMGKPYRLGRTGPNIFDCSGLVKYVYEYKLKLVTLPRLSRDQYASAPIKSRNLYDARPGDLLFFHSTGKSNPWNPNKITHVAIYIGNDKMIHAVTKGVSEDSVYNKYYHQRFYGVGRYIY